MKAPTIPGSQPGNPKLISARQIPPTNVMANHFQSPRTSVGKKPKQKLVHEKPIGAELNWPVRGFSRYAGSYPTRPPITHSETKAALVPRNPPPSRNLIEDAQ